MKQALKPSSDGSAILYLLSVLMNENNKIQKAGFKVLAQMDYASSGVVKPIFVFFDANKEEIIHNSDNILKTCRLCKSNYQSYT